MVAATQCQAGSSLFLPRPGWRALLVCAAALAPLAGPALAQEPENGAYIKVRARLDSRAVEKIKSDIDRAFNQKDARVTTIIFDFNPDDRSATSDDYGTCRNLAQILLRLQQDVTTVAFVHRDVTGHLVLPVLACKEIVMASAGDPKEGARLGNVRHGLKEPLSRDELIFYEEVVTRRGRPPALVMKMLDPDVEVVHATRKGAPWFIDKRREAEEKKNEVIVTNPEPVLPAGEIGFYTGKQAQDLGLVIKLAETRQELVQKYHLPPSIMRDPLQGNEARAHRIPVQGTLDQGAADSLSRRIRSAIGQQHRANFLILEIRCNAGSTLAAHQLAEQLRTLTDDSGKNPVMTVAYIPPDPEGASETATFLALGCTEIVMHKDAKLGNFERVLAKTKDTELLRKSLEGLAQAQGYPPLAVRGFLEPDLAFHRVRTKKAPIEWLLVTAEEFARDQAGEHKWEHQGQIKHAGKVLVLDAPLARQLGIARHVVQDPGELYRLYGIDEAEVRRGGPDWLDRISDFLRQPTVGLFLIMIGITCLILELKMPGVGLPGVLAALCFVLYFWAHSQLAGQTMWLAILLFLLGLILIGVEIFVIPGFGVTGFSGILMMIVSLALVTLEKKPETTQEWISFGGTLSTLGLSLVGAIVVAMLIARSFPSLPYANRLVLQPPTEANAALEEAGLAEVAGAGPSPAALALLGAIGVAVTPLRPAGINDDFVDVVAEGSYVEPGTRVQVIEIEGNRIAVKEV
jgi:membrane-bound serine protease (ClpP class)